MAFLNDVTFPDSISEGSTAGPGYNTNVLETGDGDVPRRELEAMYPGV